MARYLRIFLALSVLAFAAVCGTNFGVDPYGIYPVPRLGGFNAIKPNLAMHERMAKAHVVRNFRPAGLIIGSSRAEFGLDPDHPGWAAEARPVYNLSLSGGGIYETLRYMQHGLAAGEIRQAVLAIDLWMFDPDARPKAGFSEARLLRALDGTPQAVDGAELWRLAASFDTLEASLKTVRHQKDLDMQIHLGNGMTRWRDGATWLRTKEGHRKQFGYMEHMFGTTVWRPDTRRRWRFDADAPSHPRMADFRAMVRLAHAQNADLRMVISPSHARIWEVIHGAGLWDQWQHWKRRLLEITFEEAERAGKAPLPLWDFSGHNSVTTEELPPPGRRAMAMQWYWDGSHYKPAAGDLVLDRVFGIDRPGHPVPEDFGVRLSAANIEPHLANLRRQREIYAERRPREVKAAQRWRRDPSMDSHGKP